MTVLFTAARNRFAQALLAVYSFVKYHPNARLVFVLCDEADNAQELESFLPEGTHLMQAKDMGIPHFKAMAFQYTVYELCCAIRFHAMEYALKLFPNDRAFYCDGDLLFFSPIHEALELLEKSSVVLTPHRAARDFPHKKNAADMERLTGLYNGGFWGLSNTQEGHAFLHWMQTVTARNAFLEYTLDEFLDQRWLELAPIFFPRTAILNHPGYNSANWNLDQRRCDMSCVPPKINGLPARFFHLSGFNFKKPTEFWWYFNRSKDYYGSTPAPFMPLYKKTLDALLSEPTLPPWEAPYAYDFFADGRPISKVQRRAFAQQMPWPLSDNGN